MSSRIDPRADFQLAACLVQPSKNDISRDSVTITVEPKVMDLLVTFAGNPEHVFNRDELIEHVWGGRVVSDEAVNRIVFELRKAFRELGVRRDIIRTVRKRGYQLNRPPVAVDTNPEKDPVPQRPMVTAILILLTVAAYVVYQSFNPSQELPLGPDENTVITITPFISREAEPGLTALGKALAQSVSSDMAQQEGFTVRDEAVSSSTDRAALHPDLEASYTVDGVLGTEQGRPFTTIRIRDRKGATKWSQSFGFEASASGISEVANDIATALSKFVAGNYQQPVTCRWVDDISAIELYYDAQRLVSLRGEKNIREAITLLKQAIRLEPGFAQAWSAIAWAYALLPAHIEDRAQAGRERATLIPLADQAAYKALEICADQGVAHMLVGKVPGHEGDHPLVKSDYLFRDALKLEPSNAETRRHYGDILYRFGRLQESQQMMREALERNPYNARIYRELAEFQLNHGDFEGARSFLGEADRLGYSGPRHQWWRLDVLSGDWTHLVNSAPQNLEAAMTALVDVMRQPGEKETRIRLQRALQEAREFEPRDGLTLSYLAGIWINDADLAWDSFDSIDPSGSNGHSLWWPESAGLRADPRFNAYVSEQGFLEYWHQLKPPDLCVLKLESLECPTPSAL